MDENRTRRYAMRHEQTPSGDVIDVGLKMASACIWFAVLLPIGLLIAALWVSL